VWLVVVAKEVISIDNNDDKEMRVVELVADPYPPYQYDEGGTVKGIDHDIIAAAFGEFLIETRIRLLPWEACIEQMEMKQADGIFQIAPTPERKKTYAFSHPLRTARTVFFKKSGSPVRLHGNAEILPQLTKFRIGVLSGYSYDPVIDRLKEPVKIAARNQEQLLKDLLAGKLDMALMDSGVASYLMQKMHIVDIEPVKGYQISRQLHVAFQKNLDKLVHIFNAGLKKIKESGLYNKILDEFGLHHGE